MNRVSVPAASPAPPAAIPADPFALRPFGSTGLRVTPLGLSASYLPGQRTVRAAVDEGINLFFAYGFDRQMFHGLRDALRSRRDRLVLVTGAYNFVWWAQNVRRALEKRLRQFKTDYLDVFLFLGVMKPAEFTPKVRETLRALKAEGKVRAIGISGHDRILHGQLAASGEADALMLRYNAAHRGAERDIFPHTAAHDPGVLGYTATRWTYLTRRTKSWPRGARIPTAGECYRFVLSNPHVHCVLTAPRSERELRENVAAVRRGALDPDDLAFMREYGDAVHGQNRWFM
jgi:aryl-alcohol dehydrogenase-like predicted oxidoreductase